MIRNYNFCLHLSQCILKIHLYNFVNTFFDNEVIDFLPQLTDIKFCFTFGPCPYSDFTRISINRLHFITRLGHFTTPLKAKDSTYIHGCLFLSVNLKKCLLLLYVKRMREIWPSAETAQSLSLFSRHKKIGEVC